MHKLTERENDEPLLCANATGDYQTSNLRPGCPTTRTTSVLTFIHPTTLREEFALESKATSRAVQVHFPDAPFRRVIAVGEAESPFAVRMFDVTRTQKRKLPDLCGLRGRVTGLAALTIPSSDPLIVADSFSMHEILQLLIFNARTGKQVGCLPKTVLGSHPSRTYRIITVPTWGHPEVFRGAHREIHRYDVSRAMHAGKYVLATPVNMTALAAIPTLNLLVSNGYRTVQLWSRDGYQCVATFPMGEWAQSLYCAEDKHLILAGGQGSIIYVWDYRKTRECLRRFVPSVGARFGVAVRDIDRIDENSFVSGGIRISVWDPSTGQVLRETKKEYGTHTLPICHVRVFRSPPLTKGATPTQGEVLADEERLFSPEPLSVEWMDPFFYRCAMYSALHGSMPPTPQSPAPDHPARDVTEAEPDPVLAQACPSASRKDLQWYASQTVDSLIDEALSPTIPTLEVTYAEALSRISKKYGGFRVLIFGGIVRDALQGTGGHDVDVTYSCSAKHFQKAAEMEGWSPSGSKSRQDGAPLIYVRFPGNATNDNFVEGFNWKHSMFSALAERDFTCNTIAYDLDTKKIISRTPTGLQDAQGRVLRIPVDSEEDRARWAKKLGVFGLMRFWKFQTREYRPFDPSTTAFIVQCVKKFFSEQPKSSAKGMSSSREHACEQVVADLERVMKEDVGDSWFDRHVAGNACVNSRRPNREGPTEVLEELRTRIAAIEDSQARTETALMEMRNLLTQLVAEQG